MPKPPLKPGEHEILAPEDFFEADAEPPVRKRGQQAEGLPPSVPWVDFVKFQQMVGGLMMQRTLNPQDLGEVVSIAGNLREYEAMVTGLVAKELARFIREDRHFETLQLRRYAQDLTAHFITVKMGHPNDHQYIEKALIKRLSELGLTEIVRVQFASPVVPQGRAFLGRFVVNILPHK